MYEESYEYMSSALGEDSKSYTEFSLKENLLTIAGRNDLDYKNIKLLFYNLETGVSKTIAIINVDEEGYYFDTIDLSAIEDSTYHVTLRASKDGISYNYSNVFRDLILKKDGTKFCFLTNSKVYKENQNLVKENLSLQIAESYLDTSLKDDYVVDGVLTEEQIQDIYNFSCRIVGSETNQYEQLRLIFEYLANNIYYDTDGFNDPSQDVVIDTYELYQSLLQYDNVPVAEKRTKTVCDGFAGLTVSFARNQGIPARLVQGNIISIPTNKLEDLNEEIINHVWVEAYVDRNNDGTKEWVTIDPTRSTNSRYENGKWITEGGLSSYLYFDTSLKAISSAYKYIQYRNGSLDGQYVNDEYELQALKSFLNTKDNNEVINGIKINPEYREDSPKTWYMEPTSHIQTDGFGKVSYIDWNGNNIKDYEQRLTGNLDVSNFNKLKNLFVYDNDITGINLEGCTELLRVSINFNDVTTLDTTDSTKLNFIGAKSNPLTDAKFYTEEGIVNISSENGGAFGFEYDIEKEEELYLNAIVTDNAYRFAGWYAGEELISVEKECTTNITDLAITAKYVTENEALDKIQRGKLISFLQIQDEEDVHNGSKLNTGYTTADLLTWYTSPGTLIQTDAKGNVSHLDWNGNNISGYNKKLTGNLDVSGFEQLTNLFVYDNDITGINLEGCSELLKLSINFNDVTILDTTDSKKLTSIAAKNNPLTDVKFYTEEGIVNITSTNGGAFGFSYNAADEQQLYLNAIITDNAYRFAGWYAGEELISTEKECTTSITYLEITAKFVTENEALNKVQREKLTSFLETVDANGILNGAKINIGYSSEYLLTWYTSPSTLIQTDAKGNVSHLDWNGNNIKGYSQKLIGNLDVSGFEHLTNLFVYDNDITGINLEGCSELLKLSLNFNDVTTLDTRDSKKLTSIAAKNNPLIDVKFYTEEGIVNITSTNGGAFGFSYNSGDEQQLYLNAAVTDKAYRFAGWYAGEDLISTEKECTASITDLEITAKFVTENEALNVEQREKLINFLETEDYGGVPNGDKLNADFIANDLHTWYTSPDTLIQTDAKGNVSYLNWNGNNIKGYSQKLIGNLDMSGFASLTNLFVHDNDITGINLTGCTELSKVSLNYNDVTTLDTTDSKKLTSIAARVNPLTNAKFYTEEGIVTIAATPGGTFGFAYNATDEQPLYLNAIVTDKEFEFAGWYAGETLISTEKECTTEVTDFEITAKFVTIAKPLESPVAEASNSSTGKIVLTWTAVSGADKYEVWYSLEENGSYTKLITTTGTKLTHSSAVSGKTYYYKVRAIDADNAALNSEYSGIVEASVGVKLKTPVVSVSNSSTGKIVLTWESVSGASKCEVWYCASQDGEYKKLITTTGTKLTHSSAVSGSSFYYKVRAINAANENGSSYYSTAVKGTAK